MNRNFCNQMDEFLEQYYEQTQISGSLRVTLKDEIIYEKFMGFADIEGKSAFTKQSVFTLYSLSKPFCAIGLLKLKDQKFVDLDCHPSVYLPEAKNFDKRLTIRHMLHHISGLPDFVLTAKFQEKYKTGYARQIREHLKELSHYPMVFEPGTDFMYANVNFVICALMIENVSGMSYADYMQKEVFAPLGMTTAKVDGENVVVANRVKGHELQNDSVIPVDRSINWMLGGGDILGTVDDVYCLNKAIKHKLLLKPETWKEVLTPSPLHSMGMGCSVTDWYGKLRIMHNGGSRGFRTLHIQLPEDDFDIIFLSNSGWGNARSDIAEALYEAYYGTQDGTSEEVKMDAGYI